MFCSRRGERENTCLKDIRAGERIKITMESFVLPSPKKALLALVIFVETESFAERLLCHCIHLTDFLVVIEISPRLISSGRVCF